jgi:DNA-directed RNA polymerase specialized sigma subunit
MPSFSYDPSYQTSFDSYMAPVQVGSMQYYFGYLAQSMYHLHLNEQQEMQARLIFEQQFNDEFTNFHYEISNL